MPEWPLFSFHNSSNPHPAPRPLPQVKYFKIHIYSGRRTENRTLEFLLTDWANGGEAARLVSVARWCVCAGLKIWFIPLCIVWLPKVHISRPDFLPRPSFENDLLNCPASNSKHSMERAGGCVSETIMLTIEWVLW
jgi:hypothetical protein